MEEFFFDAFREASEHAKLLSGKGWKDVRVKREQDQFKVSGVLPLPTNHNPLPTNNTPTQKPVKQETSDHEEGRLCNDCQKLIPEERIAIAPNSTRCVSCQAIFEKTHDTRPRINEGIAGTREENKKMRGQVWGDLRNRNRGS